MKKRERYNELDPNEQMRLCLEGFVRTYVQFITFPGKVICGHAVAK